MVMQVIAWLAAGLVYWSFFMKTIVPLRTLAIASNLVFICYALLGLHYDVFDKVLPILVLHCALLPLNVKRLREVTRTIRAARQATGRQSSLDVLLPFMKHESVKKGETLFKIGDKADKVFLLRQGRIALPEVNKFLVAGDFFGEVGVFAESAQRTASAVCETDCEVLSMTSDKVLELFYQDARFGIFIARLLSRYLSNNSGLARN